MNALLSRRPSARRFIDCRWPVARGIRRVAWSGASLLTIPQIMQVAGRRRRSDKFVGNECVQPTADLR
ncbi:hypothetical protein FJU30_04490 [Affinibrenneria salicis]|uniref:Uncharacterized protein n=1 Tax=Affinibrenneria salicis TaxID=2590031 RepID=A0A5J5G7U8_9GAMM|nr:hypothetical protein FJU30_00275 [Affinibrenneria salicis]KAA9003231.1 hypothetical protein FJU30_04490 [Affinibrenneria salicis]